MKEAGYTRWKSLRLRQSARLKELPEFTAQLLEFMLRTGQTTGKANEKSK
jgi:hypothetical protein